MSDFPVPEQYQNQFSSLQLKKLRERGFTNPWPVVIKKEKQQFLYDIDQNKYVDFCLNQGTVILGHTDPLVSRMIKDGISSGLTGQFAHKFDLKLLKFFDDILPSPSVAFFHHLGHALLKIFHLLGPKTIGANTDWGVSVIRKALPKANVEIADKEKRYDLLFLEPIDFNGDLSDVDYHEYQAIKTVSLESRTAFRLKYGFIKNLSDADYIVSSNNIANGMDCAAVFSKEAMEGEQLPLYLSLTIMETLKAYQRKMDYLNFKWSGSFQPEWLNQSIFKLNRSYLPQELLPYGVALTGNTGFLSALHTPHDMERLAKALKRQAE